MRALAFALALVPQGVWALSCIPLSIEEEFRRIQESVAVYSVVAGRLSFDPGIERSGFDENGQRVGAVFPARITGDGLGPDGFQPGVAVDVTVIIDCVGQWCGGVSPRDEIYILRRETDGYYLYAGPCRAPFLPTSINRARFEACMAEGC